MMMKRPDCSHRNGLALPTRTPSSVSTATVGNCPPWLPDRASLKCSMESISPDFVSFLACGGKEERPHHLLADEDSKSFTLSPDYLEEK